MSSCMYSSILIIMHSSLTEIVSASVAGQISSDSSNVVELIEVRSDRGGMVSMSRLSRILNINTKFTKLDAGTDADVHVLSAAAVLLCIMRDNLIKCLISRENLDLISQIVKHNKNRPPRTDTAHLDTSY